MLHKLINAIQEIDRLPIEVPEVRDEIIRIGVQDEIVFCPDDRMDPDVLRGTYYQYTYRQTLYGDPKFVSLIVYCSKLSLPWQRIVCCKEMVHILDVPSERTRSEDELEGLLSRLLGPMSTEDFGICDIMAAKDRLALYQALPLLFPMNARERALKSGATIEDIAEIAVIPRPFAALVMSEGWPALLGDLTC